MALVAIDTQADKATCGQCGTIRKLAGEDAFTAAQRHIEEAKHG